jgi:membrane associated rhomboid family serine protease
MGQTGIITILLIFNNVLFTYRGFKNELFFERFMFEVDGILVKRQWNRILSSGFLHVSWLHLIMNMITLLLFAGTVESFIGPYRFLLIYFASLVGGNLLSLLIHRNEGSYTAVGASGAVSGVVFACIALFPGMDVSLFFIPLWIPAWLFGLLYILSSIYGIRSRKDNIGHDAHLGGALIGMLVAILLYPNSIVENYVTILLVAGPAIIFIYLIITRPHLLLVDNFFFKKKQRFYSVDHRDNVSKTSKQQEIDRILEKIHQKGMRSLSKKERQLLKEYSKNS